MLPRQRFRLLSAPSHLTKLPSWPDGNERVTPFICINNYRGYYRVYREHGECKCSRCGKDLQFQNVMGRPGDDYCPSCGLREMVVEWHAAD